MKRYCLFLVTDDEMFENYFSNKHFVYSETLDDIDSFTSCYENAQELGDDINIKKIPRKFVDAVIISLDNLNYMSEHHQLFPRKEEKVLFSSDREFVTNMKNSFYDDVLIHDYKEFLLSHRREIGDSLVRFVHANSPVNSYMTDKTLEQVFYSYYKKKTYKKIRDTYLDLNRKKRKYRELGKN